MAHLDSLSLSLSSLDQGTTQIGSSPTLVLHTRAKALKRALSTQNLVAWASDLCLSVKSYLEYVTEMECRVWDSHKVSSLDWGFCSRDRELCYGDSRED
jgi:hypothetical protein